MHLPTHSPAFTNAKKTRGLLASTNTREVKHLEVESFLAEQLGFCFKHAKLLKIIYGRYLITTDLRLPVFVMALSIDNCVNKSISETRLPSREGSQKHTNKKN